MCIREVLAPLAHNQIRTHFLVFSTCSVIYILPGIYNAVNKRYFFFVFSILLVRIQGGFCCSVSVDPPAQDFTQDFKISAIQYRTIPEFRMTRFAGGTRDVTRDTWIPERRATKGFSVVSLI